MLMFKCMTYLTIIYLVFSILQSTERPDFLNLTIGTVAILFLSNRETIRQSSFRNLVLAMVLSVIFDSAWLSLEWDTFEQLMENDSAGEETLKVFSFQLCILSLILRPIIILFFWRASMIQQN